MRILKKTKRQQHIDTCATLLVEHEMDWFSEGHAYLRGYWRNYHLHNLFNTYQEFAEEVSYAMNRILLGQRQSPPVLRLASMKHPD